MTRSMRSSAKWFNLGLWLVALVFAGFLIGLGGIVVDDLPQVEQHFRNADIVDEGAAAPLRSAIKQARAAQEIADPSVSMIVRQMPSGSLPLRA